MKTNINWGKTAQRGISIFHYLSSSWSLVREKNLEYTVRPLSSSDNNTQYRFTPKKYTQYNISLVKFKSKDT